MTSGDRGPLFDGVKIGRPATGALIDAGYLSISDLPERLEDLLALHGVGPRAIRLLGDARRGDTN
ncbi:helix-hairpin-helix domain-containing protein [Nocardia sp. NPDC003345]